MTLLAGVATGVATGAALTVVLVGAVTTLDALAGVAGETALVLTAVTLAAAGGAVTA